MDHDKDQKLDQGYPDKWKRQTSNQILYDSVIYYQQEFKFSRES